MSETDQKPPKFNLRWNKGGDSYRLGDQYEIFRPFQPNQNKIDNNDKKRFEIFLKKKKKKNFRPEIGDQTNLTFN